MSCSQCGKCCGFIDFTVNTPAPVPHSTKEYFDYHNVEVIQKRNKVIYRVWNKCKHLNEDNMCDIWETRPQVCRNTKTNSHLVKPDGCTDK